MKTIITLLALLLLPLTACASDLSSGTACIDGKCQTPNLALANSGSIPADLAAAIQAVEADKALLASDNSVVAAATAALNDATKAAKSHSDQLAKDQAASQVIWNAYYPPAPSPTPEPTPPAPTPPAPPAPTADVVTLALVSNAGTSFTCPACASVHAESVPTLKASLGSNFSEYAYTDQANVAKVYPTTADDTQSGFIPRWTLTHSATGKTTKAVGYLSLSQLQGWIAGTYTPPSAH